MKKLVTHNQGFHSDDAMAYAILKEVLTKKGETWTLQRSRDQAVIDAADIVFDVGEVYDPGKNRYDHHQKGRAGARENGVLYASCGLVWKHFGRELCSNEAVWKEVDKKIIMEIDAVDSGQTYMSEPLFKDAGYMSLGNHIANFSQLGTEGRTEQRLLEVFEEASEFARGVLARTIRFCEALEHAFQEVSAFYKQSQDKQILVLEKDYGRPTWRSLSAFPELIFVVYHNDKADRWSAEGIPVDMNNMISRKLFPESWRGLREDELKKVTGVSDIMFCHPSGFLLGAHSKESALALAKKALLM